MSSTAVAMNEIPDSEARTLRMTRTFAAARETVFKAFTEPERFAKWWGPKDTTVPECDMDARPGGRYRAVMRASSGKTHIVTGVYREVQVPERLVFTWAWENDGVPGHETLVTLEFHDRDGKTELVLTQSLFETVDGRDMHGEGWTGCLDGLDAYLAEGAAA